MVAASLPRIITPERHTDERGWFSETFREQRLYDLGIACRFVQENQSYSKTKGTLRGLHFQRPPAAQAKLISVLQGRILDVAVDLRSNSPTFGKHISVELSAEAGQQLYVPIGFAHGFVTLENDVMVSYKVSDYYAWAHEYGIRWDDPQIGIAWPFQAPQLVISNKDRQLPLLKGFLSPFEYDGHPLTPLTTTDR